MKAVRITLFLAATMALAGCDEGQAPTSADLVAACVACHTFGEAGPTLSGPNLYGIVGEKAGTRAGFAYSSAMRDSGVVWTPEALDAFLQAPAKFIPGNRMAFSGEKDAARRAAVIEHMQAHARTPDQQN